MLVSSFKVINARQRGKAVIYEFRCPYQSGTVLSRLYTVSLAVSYDALYRITSYSIGCCQFCCLRRNSYRSHPSLFIIERDHRALSYSRNGRALH